MRPMLARTLGPKFNQYPCYIQPKLNGIRALFQHDTFQSRDEKLWRTGVLQHLIAELDHLELGSVILDGELYVHGWRLQRINSAVAVNRLEPTEDTPHVEYHVFDVVDPQRKFNERWFDILTKINNAKLPHIKAVDTLICHDREFLGKVFHHYTAQGYEGVMLRPDGPYEFGEHLGRGGTMTSYRSRTLWKYKSWEDGEWECVGVTQGEGKADIGIGALVCVLPTRPVQHARNQDNFSSFETQFKVGTGFTDEERIHYMTHPPIGKLVKIRYLELTKDGIPFNPSFLCIIG